MKVLFTQEVPGTAQAGQIKEVSNGYARNYLIPKKLAVPASEAALRQLDAERKAEARRQAKQADADQTLASRLGQTTVTFRVRVGQEHRLYGSITNTDIAEALEKQLGQPIDRRKVVLEEPIRHLGSYQVPVHLSRGLEPHVTVVVEPE
ncbi:MAG: 50S ribosomal protein L9 [Chloroflexi bacterium]|nr:50S ribosomal protein L9 [Chloroflexota bacterium]